MIYLDEQLSLINFHLCIFIKIKSFKNELIN